MKYIGKLLVSLLTAALLISGIFGLSPTEVQAASSTPYVIVLDPGHDSTHARGTNKASGVVEEDYTLSIAKSLKKKLEKYGFTVYLTRDSSKCPCGSGSNTTECLEYRVNYAKACGCDLYVSLHLNANGTNNGEWTTAHGSTVYITNYSKYRTKMQSLASYIGSELKSECGITRRDTKGTVKKSSEGTYSDGSALDYLKVLRESSYQGFPSVLIEHLFMDNKNDVSILKSEGAAGLAEADCQGIVSWYKDQYGSLPTSGTVGYVTGDRLNLRSSAGTSGSIVATLKKNDSVIIYGSKNGWYQVVAKRGTSSYKGYVNASYIKKGIHSVSSGSAAPSGSSSGSSGSSGSYTNGYVNYYFLNLRKSASTDSTIVCRLDKNDTLKLYSHSGNWYKVTATHNGKTYSGYVYDTYVKKGTPSGSSSSSSSGSSYTTAGYVSNSILNLRKSASTSSDKIVTLVKYDTLMLGKKSNGWYPVKATHNGKTYTGYVKSDYVTTGHVGYVNYTYLNVRKGAGTGYKKIDELDKYDKVVIVGTSGSWYEIRYVKDGTTYSGYVLSSYITR